jgi:hypothetical protein
LLSHRGTIGIEISDTSAFALINRAERAIFVIDTIKTMRSDKKGGLRSSRIIKESIADLSGIRHS